MPDETIVAAGKSLIDAGVLGTGLLLTISALIFVTKRLLATQDALLLAKEEHKNDAVKFAAMGEVFKNQMQVQAELMKATIDRLQDRRLP